MKKLVRVEAAPGLFVETALVAVPAIVVLAVPARRRRRAPSATRAPVTRCCWSSSGVATAVPLLLFAAAARRIPLSTVGLLQYLTPLMQLAIGVFVYDEPMPPARLAGFAIVWVALAVFTADMLRHARAGSRRVDRRRPFPPVSDGLRRPPRGGSVGGVRELSVAPRLRSAVEPPGHRGRPGTAGEQTTHDRRPHPGGLPAPGRGVRGGFRAGPGRRGCPAGSTRCSPSSGSGGGRPGPRRRRSATGSGCTPTRYYQVLNALVDRPDALAADPLLVRRLRRLRLARQRTRSSRGPGQ